MLHDLSWLGLDWDEGCCSTSHFRMLYYAIHMQCSVLDNVHILRFCYSVFRKLDYNSLLFFFFVLMIYYPDGNWSCNS